MLQINLGSVPEGEVSDGTTANLDVFLRHYLEVDIARKLDSQPQCSTDSFPTNCCFRKQATACNALFRCRPRETRVERCCTRGTAPPQAKPPWRLPSVTIKSFNLHVATKERPAHLHVTTPIGKLSITIYGRNQQNPVACVTLQLPQPFSMAVFTEARQTARQNAAHALFPHSAEIPHGPVTAGQPRSRFNRINNGFTQALQGEPLNPTRAPPGSHRRPRRLPPLHPALCHVQTL